MKLRIDISLINENDAINVLDKLKENIAIYYDVYKTICAYEPVNVDEQILIAYISTMNLSKAANCLDEQGIRSISQNSGQYRKVSQRDIVNVFDKSNIVRQELIEFAKIVHRVNKGEIGFNEMVKRVKNLAE